MTVTVVQQLPSVGVPYPTQRSREVSSLAGGAAHESAEPTIWAPPILGHQGRVNDGWCPDRRSTAR
ncbi:MAG TPA: hypothetical protein VFE86_13690 [Ilumatobacteraceae bacterium]|nr:hypothetical protein [Ilumatobacteraceae bacterium]